MPYDRPGVRIERLAEALAVVKGAWGDGPFDFAGEHYTITAYDGLPEAAAAAAPADPRRRWWAEAAAARRARGRHRRHQPDPPCRRDRCRSGTRHARRLDRSARSGGSAKARGSASTTSSCRSATSSPRSPTTPQALAEAHGPRRSASTADEALGVGRRARRLGRRGLRHARAAPREEWGVSYVVLGDDTYEQFAPVVARLAGT